MRRDWPAEAVAYQESVRKALRAIGGADAARAAEAHPAQRDIVVAPALDQLGLRALDPWGDEEESAAAVLGVAAAGSCVLPWPLVHALAVPVPWRSDVGGVFLTAGTTARLDHADLLPGALAVDIRTGTARPITRDGRHPGPLDPFACDVTLGAAVPFDATSSVHMHILLDAFWVGGALHTAVDLALAHARERRQFNTPIGQFGEIRWRIADMVVARDGLDELALHAWWLLHTGAARSADLLALRVQMIESAEAVLANGHQILGAMGLCEEHDLTVIDRHLQSVLHRPAGRIVSTDLFAAAVAREGFDGVYPVAAWE